MKNIKNIILLLSLVLLSSCNGFLEKAPILDQSTDITMSTYAGLNSAVAGAYGPLYSTTWYGADYVITGEMRSGNGRREADGDFQSNRYIGDYNWNYSEDVTSGMWGMAYYVISAVNNVLANLEGKEAEGVTTQDLNNLKAECLFLRALSHFDIVRLYGQPYTSGATTLGVPVVLVTDPNGKPARNTVEEVYKQIVTDLLDAEAAIDPTYTRKGVVDVKSSADIYSIQALLARVYSSMGDWANAAKYASKVIDSKKFNVWTPEQYLTAWSKNIADKDGEVIFEVYGKKSNEYYGSWENIQYVTSPEGYADAGVSKDVTSLYTATDVRAKLLTTDKNNASGGLLWSKKYAGKGDGTPDCSNIIVLRLSEMYLIRAEAAINGAETGSTAEADINAVREKRGLSSILAASKADIQKEYRLEFLYEGHYFFDLARWGLPVNRVDYTGDIKNQNVEFPSYLWALPIAKRELEVNENLEQNPNY
jgi:starch-binding outer membrane protein, SusD/RagB family